MKLKSFAMVLVAAAIAAPLCEAQYYPRPGYPAVPYNPYVPGYYPPNGPGYNAGAYLNGSADVMRSYGDVITKQEEARILREKANQAKLDTRKQAFDQMLYEKANTPTYTETVAKESALLLTRVMNNPIQTEITSGKSLNLMLPYVQTLSSHGTMGPPIPIPQSIVNQLNISGSEKSSVGMLRDGGRLEWPVGLMGPHQKNLDKLLPQAYDAAATGKLTPKLMKDVRTETKALRDDIRKQYQKEEMETSTYLVAVDFYNNLESSVNALEKPDAKKQLSGAYSPRARNVQELIDFMGDNGLHFAPASPGNENAYQVAHDAFVRYARSAQGSSGFQALNAPIPAPRPKKQ
jgi:hypothetical protein